LQKSLHRMSYHIWGCMAFRSNELGHDLDHGIVCQNNPISDTRVAIGTTRDTTELVSCFVPWKVCFPFLECHNRVFCVAATELTFQKLDTTSHINNRPPMIRISALISTYESLEVSSKFWANSYRFRWKWAPNVWVGLYANNGHRPSISYTDDLYEPTALLVGCPARGLRRWPPQKNSSFGRRWCISCSVVFVTYIHSHTNFFFASIF
jgi:hypothetical protein